MGSNHLKKRKSIGLVLFIPLCILVLYTVSPGFNFFIAKTQTRIKCSLGLGQLCHNSIISMLNSQSGFPYLVKNCYKNSFSPSCLTVGKILQKQNDPNFVYYLQKSCFLGHKPSCLLSTEAALQLWSKEIESKKVINSSGKYISLAFNSISQGCILKDSVACEKYSSYWSNITLRKSKLEYDCINSNKRACLQFENLKQEQGKIQWLNKKYFSLKTQGYSSASCRIGIHEPYSVGPSPNRQLASRTVLNVDIKADLINNKIDYTYDRPIKTALEVLLRRVANDDLISTALPFIFSGYASINKDLNYAYSKAGWLYFQNQTAQREPYYLTFNEKDGRHYNQPPLSEPIKTTISHEKKRGLFYPKRIIASENSTGSDFGQQNYYFNWKDLPKQRIAWPQSIHTLSKDSAKGSPLIRIDFTFDSCRFKKKNKIFKETF